MFPIRLCSQEDLPLGARTLRFGCFGRDVLALQRSLLSAGFSLETDAVYGYATEEAVRKMQRQSRLPVDGRAGPATLAALRDLITGAGYLVHRVRAGETEQSLARALGLNVEAMRRQNHLRPREKPLPGALLRTRPRAVIVDGAMPVAPALRWSARLGPRLRLRQSGVEPAGAIEGRSLPVLEADLDTWRSCLAGRRYWPAVCRALDETKRAAGWRSWCVEIPSALWSKPRPLIGLLAAFSRACPPGPIPILLPPGGSEPAPDLTALAPLASHFILDPGFRACHAGELIRFIRWAASVVPSRRLLISFHPGGFLRPAAGEPRLVPPSEARAIAISAHARFVWHETARIYRASHSGEDGSWELFLLEERALRERAALIDRLDCAGLVLSGASHLNLAPVESWPGEFAVLEEFPPPAH